MRELLLSVLETELLDIRVRGVTISDEAVWEFMADWSVVYLEFTSQLWECSLADEDCSLKIRSVKEMELNLPFEIEENWRTTISSVLGHSILESCTNSHVAGIKAFYNFLPSGSKFGCRALQIYLKSDMSLFIDPVSIDGILLGDTSAAERWQRWNPEHQVVEFGDCRGLSNLPPESPA